LGIPPKRQASESQVVIIKHLPVPTRTPPNSKFKRHLIRDHFLITLFRPSKSTNKTKNSDPSMYNVHEELAGKYGKTHVFKVKTMEDFDQKVI
jgi:hypothetical protein